MISTNIAPPWQLTVSVLSIAFLYASVGFGGASGYLAVMSMFMISPQLMSTTSLTLNILVSGIAFITYYRARHFTPRTLWPFLLTSIPLAFIGGYIHVKSDIYLILLYLSLSYVAVRMLFYTAIKDKTHSLSSFSWSAALASGAGIGLLSGIIGIGGGIFLSPLLVLTGWGTPKQAAASSSAFIFINSITGLTGRILGGNVEFGLLGLSLLPLGLVGALGGSRLGASYISSTGLRRLLGIILLFAVLRFWLQYLG